VTSTTISGTNPADRNIISGNGHNGVNMGGIGTMQNVVVGNLIGTDKTEPEHPEPTRRHSNLQGSTIRSAAMRPASEPHLGQHAKRHLIEGRRLTEIVLGNYIGRPSRAMRQRMARTGWNHQYPVHGVGRTSTQRHLAPIR
jgi:hypothetical protein